MVAMADNKAYTEDEAVEEIIKAVRASEDAAGAINLYRNRDATHEISFNITDRVWELINMYCEVEVCSDSLRYVARRAVEEELWIEA
jgi:hypothetical protein